MQPAVFSSVRTNLASLPRSISPHIASPTSPSSIRSLSPSRTSHLRSRSSSPSPRRFASVLAYHATPPPEGYGRSKRTGQEDQPNHQHTEGSRDENPSSDAVKNLEESWRRFELEASSQTSPTLAFSNSSFNSPHYSRPSSPLSRKPYRELIECNSFKSSKLNESTMAPKDKPTATNRSKDGQDQISVSESSTTAVKDAPEGAPHHIVGAASGLSSGPSSAPQERLSTATASAHQSNRGYSSTFLASSEARHILNLPSLLGQSPSDISSILPLVESSGPSSGGHHQPLPTVAQPTHRSQLLSNLDAKAEATAEAMTKRYAAKNLNMTETEAHRMVQVMAAEIVALHEERQQMQAKLEQARQEMLEAAQLLRMRAAESEMQDMSEEGRGRRVGEVESFSSGHGQEADEEEKQREAQRAMYAKDEWLGEHQE
ncbi:hypothetical protein BGZ92_001564 [Podila epicladia]|nr:hypothetical protein BGZ92_001564 [Podila epicladia]